jgi:glycosyltransferase involved in cell wall biosynthesis
MAYSLAIEGEKMKQNKKENKKFPTVSFVVCTLNCKDYLERCLSSIRAQDYPQKKVEIVVVDSYSTDGTLDVARKYKSRIILTKKRGYMEGKGMPKSLGCSRARGEIIITIDSDNKLVEKGWIKNMIYPLMNDKEINFSICRMLVSSEDPVINQYMSLVGTDPFAIYCSLDPQISLGNIPLVDKGKYWTYKLTRENFFIIGGYYLAIRSETLKKIGGYSRDVDNAYKLAGMGMANVAIPKNTHLHHLITKDAWDFLKKKVKWGKYYFVANKDEKHSDERELKWNSGLYGKFGKARFAYEILKNLMFFPEFFTMWRMWLKERDKAWLYHPAMTFLTTSAYFVAFIKAR